MIGKMFVFTVPMEGCLYHMLEAGTARLLGIGGVAPHVALGPVIAIHADCQNISMFVGMWSPTGGGGSWH